MERASFLNYVNEVSIDESSLLTFSWTVYNENLNHSLQLSFGDNIITTITSITGKSGTHIKSIPLTAAVIDDILSEMKDTKGILLNCTLITYESENMIGNSAAPCVVKTSERHSAPILTNAIIEDSNTKTVSLIGNNQVFIEGQSELRIICTGATAKNKAYIKGYHVEIGSQSKTTTSSTVMFGTIQESGRLVVHVYAVDSRGYYSNPITIYITVIPYSSIHISGYSARRVNNVETNIILYCYGKMTPLIINNENKNNVSVYYRYKKTSDTIFNEWSSLLEAVSNESFSLNELIELPAEYSYDIEIKAIDALTEDIILTNVNKSTPVIAIRKGKVGVNNSDPQAAVDVRGDILLNGNRVHRFENSILDDVSLDNVISPGILYVANNNSCPTPGPGVLEVMPVGDIVFQRYTSMSCLIYMRMKSSNSWSSWKEVGYGSNNYN